MESSVRTLLAGWQSFYVIVGSVAGSLIGLQFVVMALVADARRRASLREIAAFGTPTVLHFSAALLLSALANAPWGSVTGLHYALAACGALGVGYTFIVIGRAKRTPNYVPQFEDWVWHAVIPLVTYLALLGSGVTLEPAPSLALALLAAATLVLVFIGIHNSWDTITWVATDAQRNDANAKQ